MTPHHANGRQTVLVVDDTEGNRYSIARILRGAGFDVDEAASGREALTLAARQPDVVVLDVNLPDLSGFEVARRLRGDPDTALIPILHLSASYMRDQDRAEGLEAGANYYLTHPVDPTLFIATVRSLARVRRVEDELKDAAIEWRATFDAIRDAVFVLDADGTILRANRAAAELLRRDGEALRGRNWVVEVRDTLGQVDGSLLTDAVRARDPVVHELRGRERWYRLVLDPIARPAPHRGSLVCIVSDVTERKVAERERAMLLDTAELARADAESANQAKSEFLATMSHEIRTPINAILGYAQILDMGIPGSISEEQRVHLDRLRASATHLLGLVNEVLDLAKVESGRMRVDRERGSVDDALEAALALTRPLASARGIAIVDECGPRKSLAYVGDAGRVRQILVNLLSNAVKFTEPGGRITVDCELVAPPHGTEQPVTGPWVGIHVDDTGIGIDPVMQARVFEPFVQGESGHTRTRGGTGLGLTISRRLARMMGGDLTVRSSVGEGSRFTLWIPAADYAGAPTAEHPVVGAVVGQSFDPASLAAIGADLAERLKVLVATIVRRFRADPVLATGGTLTDAQLADHYGAYLADLFQSLVIAGDTEEGASALLRDGSAIRTLISERHGVQRHALGWSAEQVEREYAIVLEELRRLLAASERPAADAAHALELVRRLLEQSRAASLRAHRTARGEAD